MQMLETRSNFHSGTTPSSLGHSLHSFLLAIPKHHNITNQLFQSNGRNKCKFWLQDKSRLSRSLIALMQFCWQLCMSQYPNSRLSTFSVQQLLMKETSASCHSQTTPSSLGNSWRSVLLATPVCHNIPNFNDFQLSVQRMLMLERTARKQIQAL